MLGSWHCLLLCFVFRDLLLPFNCCRLVNAAMTLDSVIRDALDSTFSLRTRKELSYVVFFLLFFTAVVKYIHREITKKNAAHCVCYFPLFLQWSLPMVDVSPSSPDSSFIGRTYEVDFLRYRVPHMCVHIIDGRGGPLLSALNTLGGGHTHPQKGQPCRQNTIGIQCIRALYA